MSKQLKLIIGVVAATVIVTAAKADTIAYNTSLAAGYYNGTGNPNVGFTTDTTSTSVQLGLGVNLRFIAPVLPTSTSSTTCRSAHRPFHQPVQLLGILSTPLILVLPVSVRATPPPH